MLPAVHGVIRRLLKLLSISLTFAFITNNCTVLLLCQENKVLGSVLFADGPDYKQYRPTVLSYLFLCLLGIHKTIVDLKKKKKNQKSNKQNFLFVCFTDI